MKTLKFEHHLADLIRAGKKTATWRIRDDKHIAVNDEISLIDKVEPGNPDTWRLFASAVVTMVVEKRIADITPEDQAGHEQYDSIDDILTSFKKYYGTDIDSNTAVKIIHFQLKKDNLTHVPVQANADAPSKEIKLYADGGSRGNPGPSASGYALLSMNDKILVKNGVYLGVTTNNQAEYQALRLGLEHALQYGARTVHVYMDSLLVVNQMLGIFQVKNRDLWPIHQSIKELVPQFDHVSFAHVPRALNKIADGQVNECLDKQVSR